MTGATWYEELRERYRPRVLRILLIGESPPDPGDADRRFFYSPTLRQDNLFRGVTAAVYGDREEVDVSDKPSVLAMLRDDGYWLIDAVPYPINRLSRTGRRAAIRSFLPSLVARCNALAPEVGVVICHGGVYAVAAEPLRRSGVAVLHEQPLPFPLGNWRGEFVDGFRAALASAS